MYFTVQATYLQFINIVFILFIICSNDVQFFIHDVNDFVV